MSMYRLLITAFLLPLTVACASRPTYPPVNFSGESYTRDRSQRDVLTSIFWRTADGKCGFISSVHREVIKRTTDVSKDSEGYLSHGKVEEKWTVQACGAESEWQVILTGAEKGIYYNVGPWIEHSK